MFILSTILTCVTIGGQIGSIVGAAIGTLAGIEGAATAGAAVGTLAGTATGVNMVLEGETISVPTTVPNPGNLQRD